MPNFATPPTENMKRYSQSFSSYKYPLLWRINWRQISGVNDPNLKWEDRGSRHANVQKHESCHKFALEDILSDRYGADNKISDECVRKIDEMLILDHIDFMERNFINAEQSALRSIIAHSALVGLGATVKEWEAPYGGIAWAGMKKAPPKLVVEDIIKMVNLINRQSFPPLEDMIAIMSPEQAAKVKESGVAQEETHGDRLVYFIPTEAGNLQIITHPLMGERYNRGVSDPNIYLLDASKWEFCCTFNMPCWKDPDGLYELRRLENFFALRCVRNNPLRMRSEAIRVSFDASASRG